MSGLHAGCRDHHHFGINFNFPARGPIDVSNTFRSAVFVNQYCSHQSICQKGKVVRSLGFRDGEPRWGEERPNIAAAAAVPAVVTSKMTVVINRQLRTTVR